MSLKISTNNLSFTNNTTTVHVALYKCLDSPPVIVTCVIFTTQNMGTAQTASGCAVTPEELAGLGAVLQLIRTATDQVGCPNWQQ